MAKKRERERNQNPQPFLAGDDESVASKKRSNTREGRKKLQDPEKLISSGMSSKILKQALIQQREIEDELNEAQNPSNSLLNLTAEPPRDADAAALDEIDSFAGFDDTQSRYGDYEVSSFVLIVLFILFIKIWFRFCPVFGVNT